MLVDNFLTYLRILFIFSKIHKASVRDMEDGKCSLSTVTRSTLTPQEYVRKTLRSGSPGGFFYFFSGKRKQCGGLFCDMLHTSRGGFLLRI